MKIKSFYTNSPLRNYNHFLISDDEKSAYVFDPLDLEHILEELSHYNIQNYYLLNTHRHHDHISRNKDFLELENSHYLELKPEESFEISVDEKIMAIATPGHQPDHICYLLSENDIPLALISGDTVFNAGVGNCKDNGNVEDLYESIVKLAKLDDSIVIYPSHDYFLNNLEFALTIEPSNTALLTTKDKLLKQGVFYTSLGQEKQINPFFRVSKIKETDSFKGMTDKEVFIKIRQMRDKW